MEAFSAMSALDSHGPMSPHQLQRQFDSSVARYIQTKMAEYAEELWELMQAFSS